MRTEEKEGRKKETEKERNKEPNLRNKQHVPSDVWLIAELNKPSQFAESNLKYRCCQLKINELGENNQVPKSH